MNVASESPLGMGVTSCSCWHDMKMHLLRNQQDTAKFLLIIFFCRQIIISWAVSLVTSPTTINSFFPSHPAWSIVIRWNFFWWPSLRNEHITGASIRNNLPHLIDELWHVRLQQTEGVMDGHLERVTAGESITGWYWMHISSIQAKTNRQSINKQGGEIKSCKHAKKYEQRNQKLNRFYPVQSKKLVFSIISMKPGIIEGCIVDNPLTQSPPCFVYCSSWVFTLQKKCLSDCHGWKFFQWL